MRKSIGSVRHSEADVPSPVHGPLTACLPFFAVSPSFDINTISASTATCLTCKSRNTTPQRQSIPITRCLAAVVPRFTSLALATAPALATSPTNSNGTFPKPRPTRPSSFLSPSICVSRFIYLTLATLFRRPSVARPCSCSFATLSRARIRPAPSLALFAQPHLEAISDNLQAMVALFAATSRPRVQLRAGCKYI
jgi:hypothetical protein